MNLSSQARRQGGVQGGALAPPFQTEIYEQQHVKWYSSLMLLATHYSLVCDTGT